jgi:hypothetical protein
MQRVNEMQPHALSMPDRDQRRGEMLALYTEENTLSLRGALWSLLLCAAVVGAAITLKWAWMSLGIPYPGR